MINPIIPAFDNDKSNGLDAPEDEVLLGQSDQPKNKKQNAKCVT